MTTSAWPTAEPTVIPGGTYQATIVGEMSEQTSKFDAKRTYYTLPLKLEDKEGEEFDFIWAFGPKAPVYARFLEILGGERDPNGKVYPPENQEGRKFAIKIGEQMNREKTRQINSVLEVYADNRQLLKDKEAHDAAQATKDGTPF